MYSQLELAGDLVEFALQLSDDRLGLVHFAEECDDGLREGRNLLLGLLELFTFTEKFLQMEDEKTMTIIVCIQIHSPIFALKADWMLMLWFMIWMCGHEYIYMCDKGVPH